MTAKKPAREQENKVVLTKLPREEFVKFKDICDKEDKTINKKLRELVNQEINKNHGFPVNGTKKKFYIPTENKIVEMLEVEE